MPLAFFFFDFLSRLSHGLYLYVLAPIRFNGILFDKLVLLNIFHLANYTDIIQGQDVSNSVYNLLSSILRMLLNFFCSSICWVPVTQLAAHLKKTYGNKENNPQENNTLRILLENIIYKKCATVCTVRYNYLNAAMCTFGLYI